jgi:metal-sulfur cluster biosynthetic enzyme
MINEMLHDIQSKLDVLSDLDIEVNVVFDPLWTPEMMSNRAKIKLGLI